jgi:hypothetical protein
MDRRAFLVGAAGLVLAPEALARGAGGGPVALVTADLESHVAAVDVSAGSGGGRILRRIHTLPGPSSIESLAQGTAVVAHPSDGAVTLIDGARLRVQAVVRGLGEPRYTAVAPVERLAYVTDASRGELVTIDVATARVVHRLEVGTQARHVTRDPFGRRVWVALGSKAEHVAIVDVADARRPRLVTTVRPPFRAHDVGFTPSGNAVWVTSGDSRRVAVYDARTSRLVRELDADRPPQHVTFTTGAAFVTSGEDGLLRIHGLEGRLRRTVRVPTGSYNVQHDWDVVLTPSLSQGMLSVLARNGRLRRRVQVARSTHDACFVVIA